MEFQNSNPYTSILNYQINASGSKYPYDAYCPPLYWYIKLFSKIKKKKMEDFANDLGIDKGLLTKKLNIKSNQHRELRKEEIEKLCSIMDISLLTILQLYEHKEIVEKNLNYFDLLKNTAIEDFIKMLNKEKKPSKKIAPIQTDKWYFYFPCTDSETVKNREKTDFKNIDKVAEPEKKELYDLYSKDHIYAGIMTISKKQVEEKTKVFAKMQYLSDFEQGTIDTYSGEVVHATNDPSVFITLTNDTNNNIFFIIIDTMYYENAPEFVIASALTLSKHKAKSSRKPCSLRMIMSKNPMKYGSTLYNVMCSNLMLNDDIIRIDEHGYGEIINYKEKYRSKGLNTFLEMYPNIDSFEKSSNYVNVHKCAYIEESLVHDLKNISHEDKLYLEAILRLHSISPWYTKTKASKTNTLKELFTHNK